MLPPSMNISKETPMIHSFLEQSPDISAMQPLSRTDSEITVNGNPTQAAEEDHSYYFRDAVFLVDNTLFKVPRHHFEQSSVFFRDMFSAEADKGWTKEQPLHIHGPSKHDFVAFLKIVCPRNVFQREQLSFDEWVSVLKLSTHWNFEDARKCAIENLPFTDTDNPMLRIELAMTYKVRQWFFPALQKLAKREASLDAEDVQRLGLEFSLKVAELRGKVQGFQRAKAMLPPGAWNSANPAIPLTDFIRELFPASIVTGSDSQSWDPLSLSFLATEPGPVADNSFAGAPPNLFAGPEPDPFTGLPPATPDFKQQTKDQLLIFPLGELVPSMGPFGSPAWAAPKSLTLPSPASLASKHGGKGVGGWKVKKK